MQLIALKLRSPTCIAQRPTSPGQTTESLRYVPGTVVRAAVASLLLRGRSYTGDGLSAAERARFTQLFLSGEVRFGNAWPQHPEAPPGAPTTQVVPRTAWTDKRNDGWRGDEPGQGVQDALTALLRDGADALTRQGLDRLEQEFAYVRGDSWKQLEVKRRLISRTALARNEAGLPPNPRGVAADGQLYSFEALETGQRFVAPLAGPDALIVEVCKLLDRPTVVSIGQGRSRGMGQAEARCFMQSDPPARDLADLAKQARDFTTRAGADPTQTVYLPVTLLADTILRDGYLLPCSSGNPEETLTHYTSTPPPAMTLHYGVQSTRWLSGWDAIRRIPRPPQLAVQHGSVWVYAIPAALLDSAISWWLDVEVTGLGERRAEGFGRVMLLHPFHAKEAVR